MNMVGKMVHPDTRKGLVYVYQAEDGLIHFCWKDRTTGNVEDDLIIFPDDCEFKKVEACKTGRVYLLKFKSSSRKLFFWMQESKVDKDEEWTRRVNEVMNNPPSMSSSGSGRGGGSGSSTADNGDLQYMLNNMSQQQLMQLFGGVGQMGGLSSLLGSINRPSSGGTTTTTTKTTAAVTPSRTTTTATPVTATTPSNSAAPSTPQAPKKTTTGGSSSQEATTPATGTTESSRGVLLSELQNYLSGLTTDKKESSSTRLGNNIDLSTSINSESVNSALTDPGFVSALQAHLPNIDSSDNIKDQLKETLNSPQFQQALSMFSHALQSGQLGPLASQFLLSSEAVAAASTGDLEQFVKALELASKKKEAEGKTAEDKKDEKDDDEMTLG